VSAENLRKYGGAPYRLAVIHGGPGAPGEMAPVARRLASNHGLLEPLQSAGTLDGQVDELFDSLTTHADLPVTLVGYSWGAWLGFIVAAQSPSVVKKLILVGSGPFDERYARNIMITRLSRLDNAERDEVLALIESFNDPRSENLNIKMTRFGQLISKADAYDPVPHDDEVIEMQFHIFQNVWKEAEELRRSGELLRLGDKVKCPVVAIHGSHDPHPAEGVEKPLCVILEDFRFILMQNCGHTPWIERQARDDFFQILERECR